MSVNGLRGIERIEAVFSQAKLEKRTALMPYYSLGYPTPAQSLQVIEAIAQSGADIIELGFPFLTLLPMALLSNIQCRLL
jgi:tryptophan synthase alpha subunit